MVELLGLEAIRQTGEKASQVARLLRNTLDERRRVLNGLGDVDGRIRSARGGAVSLRPGAGAKDARQGRGARCSSRRRKRKSPSSQRSGTRNAEQKSVAPHLPLGLPQLAVRLPR